jgi:hypothetical protein
MDSKGWRRMAVSISFRAKAKAPANREDVQDAVSRIQVL